MAKIVPANADSDASYAFSHSEDGCDFYLPVIPDPPVSLVSSDPDENVLTIAKPNPLNG
jgi:hypothetical protein